MYPLYQLLFHHHGLSAAQISTLFVVWSATGFVLEVPSGAWADTYSRRKLLILGALLSGLGYAAWITIPSFTGFALGFVLWGTSSALISGTYEAFAYDELAARDRTEHFPTLLSRARSAGFVMNLSATLLAAPLFDLGGYVLAGVVSVVSCLAQAAVAWSLPETRPVENAREAAEPGVKAAFGNYLHMLRAGVSEVASTRLVRRAVLLVALLGGFLAFDEYFPLLASDTGASTGTIPLLIAGTVAAQAIGGALAGPAYKLPAAMFSAGLVLTAVLIASGALSLSAWGFLPIALGYGLMQLVIVVSEARLQDAITGPARATVTSLSGLFAEVSAIAVYAGFAVGSLWYSMAILVAALTIPVLLSAFVVPLALPAARGSAEMSDASG
ncbi:MFS transporter [Kribbella solani]|uniref:MFS transporter n=1 Tax=Kribbella solani TaxID=236067 RepID=UPI0029A9EE02|nr:MFS transporter [Kribbella solani]MDX2969910.1 MFS transporter [Kribbella solani]